MGVDAPAGLVYACITHVPLWVEFPDWVTPIHLGQAQAEGRLNLRDLAPEWEPYHPILGGTAGSFALKNFLVKQHGNATRVGLCQYRKFMSRQRIGGVPAPSYPVMDVVPKARLGRADLARAIDPGDADLLVSRPMSFGPARAPMDILTQYHHAHHVEDLLRFSAEAVTVGALDGAEVSAFLRETLFVPGGIELGIYPAAFWIRSIEAVESTVRACVRNLNADRVDYQTRAWSFCAERLGSYLLLKAFRSPAPKRRLLSALRAAAPPLPEHCIGQLNLISDEGGADYAIGSSGP